MAYVHAQDEDVNAGITLTNDCLQEGNCSIYQTLKIRQDSEDNSAQTIVQDIFLGATFFIGTLATIGFLVSGFLMVMGGASEAQYEKGKK